MSTVKENFLRYVAIDTQSSENTTAMPSTKKQFDLARMLEAELLALGATDVRLSDKCYVTATIPANNGKTSPVLGLIAHMDTSPAVSGKDVHPLVIPRYDGGDIRMSAYHTLSPAEYPALLDYVGKEIICTDGETLLGADDKAGIAEVMALAARLLAPDAKKHGTIRIGFTPDEEIGRGVDGFDVAGFHADFAYTVDGGALGEINCENFNAAGAAVTIQGVSIHTGSARGKLVNAALVGMELQSLLPAFANPACTDGYEGFFHLDRMTATVDHAALHYLIRDHDKAKFEEKKRLFAAACAYLNEKYGAGTVQADIRDTYYNMKERIDPVLVEAAKAAMEQNGVTPRIDPIRGGTDGARLSYMGLPCPNLCTGGHNFHGRYEYICTESMEKVVDILETLITSFA